MQMQGEGDNAQSLPIFGEVGPRQRWMRGVWPLRGGLIARFTRSYIVLVAQLYCPPGRYIAPAVQLYLFISVGLYLFNEVAGT